MDILLKKEMEYGKEQQIIFMAVDGDYKGVVINRTSHPCAYVQFPGIDKVEHYDSFYSENSRAHGGYTFLGELTDAGLSGTWLGWDYAHFGDFCCWSGFDLTNTHSEEHKYTIDELSEDVVKTLESIKEGYSIDEEY